MGKRILKSLIVLLAAMLPIAAAAQVTISANQNRTYGQYLTGTNGRALYMFTADRPGPNGGPATSSCYGACAQAWPPVLAEGSSVAGPQVNSSLLGTVKRSDGTSQVTYNGYPLYYYANDRGPNQFTGQDLRQFGGYWYLINPSGQVIRK